MKNMEFVFLGTNDSEDKYHVFYDRQLVCTLISDNCLYSRNGKHEVYKRFVIYLEEKCVWESLVIFGIRNMDEMRQDVVMSWLIRRPI